MTAAPPLFVAPGELEWIKSLGALRYDVVRGDLPSLRASGGDFTQATDLCLAENRGTTDLPNADTPASGEAFWYLVRGTTVADNLTYDAPGSSQIGARDAEIDQALASCN